MGKLRHEVTIKLMRNRAVGQHPARCRVHQGLRMGEMMSIEPASFPAPLAISSYYYFFSFPPVFFPLISSNGSFTESEIPRAMSSWSGWRAADPGTRGRATSCRAPAARSGIGGDPQPNPSGLSLTWRRRTPGPRRCRRLQAACIRRRQIYNRPAVIHCQINS